MIILGHGKFVQNFIVSFISSFSQFRSQFSSFSGKNLTIAEIQVAMTFDGHWSRIIDNSKELAIDSHLFCSFCLFSSSYYNYLISQLKLIIAIELYAHEVDINVIDFIASDNKKNEHL